MIFIEFLKFRISKLWQSRIEFVKTINSCVKLVPIYMFSVVLKDKTQGRMQGAATAANAAPRNGSH